ncbi:unnamed protein product, partial [Rotaria magnacalcarata]
VVSSKRIVKLFQLWKSRVALALTLYCRQRYAYYSSFLETRVWFTSNESKIR